MKRLLFVISFVALYAPLCAQDLSLYEKRTYKKCRGEELPYRILFQRITTIEKVSARPDPSWRGGTRQRQRGTVKAWRQTFLTGCQQGKVSCHCYFPTMPSEGFWSSIVADRSKTPVEFSFDYSRPMTSPLASVLEIVKRITSEEAVDQSRMYVSGLSMGGMGTFELLYHNPDMFVAAMPICGGGDAKAYDKRVGRYHSGYFTATKTQSWIRNIPGKWSIA